MSSLWTMPPRAKVYEALSAVADGRVTLNGPTTAEVVSSSHDKRYTVTWSDDWETVSSNDNASFYQGYLGYPIIAVLLSIGRLCVDPVVTEELKGVPWKSLNTKFKRDYDKAVASAMSTVPGGDRGRAAIEEAVTRVYAELATLGLKRGTRRRPPTVSR